MNPSWFGREPAVLVAQVNSALIALIMLLSLPEGITAALAALVTGVGGIVVAFAVQRDGQLSALIGLARAGIALAVVLGLPLTETYQGLIIVAVEQIASIFIRDRVVARVTQLGLPRDPGMHAQQPAA